MVENVETYYEETRQFEKVVEELHVKQWGLKNFRIEDPFGFYTRFTKYHNILDSRNAVE